MRSEIDQEKLATDQLIAGVEAGKDMAIANKELGIKEQDAAAKQVLEGLKVGQKIAEIANKEKESK